MGGNALPLDVLRKFFYREESFICSLGHINISLEPNMVSNGVARYVLKVSNFLKWLLLFCWAIIRFFPFCFWTHWTGVGLDRLACLGTHLDLMYWIYFQISCISVKIIFRFHILSLQIKAHTHWLIHIITSG